MTLQLETRLAPPTRTSDTGARACVLGGSLLGRAGGSKADWPLQTIAAPLLGSGAQWLCEVWRCAGALSAGQSEGIAWRRAGGVLYGVIEIDEADYADQPGRTALQAATEEAYRRVFRLLDGQGVPHLWRAWNYLADINRETCGLERYRQFNVGRRDAFFASQRSTVGNVPAACTIGLACGPLSIAFLAGQTPVVPVENPRQTAAYHYPPRYGPRSPTFSRAVLAYPPGQEVLFVSGTASIVGHRTAHVGDPAGQCRESLANVEAVIEAANRRARSRPYVLPELACRVYVRNAGDFPLVRETIRARLPSEAGILFLQADICRSDLLLEIEATAAHALEARG
jgi:enamine deaminase RidA (YjgF/YER057c/UK114 family)